MNWWRTSLSSIILIGFGAFLLGCSQGTDDVNKAIRPSQASLGSFFRNIEGQDSIKTSTVLNDFPVSNNSYRALIGEYNDPTFGKIVSNTYFKFVPQTKISGLNVQYDSTALYLYLVNDGVSRYLLGSDNSTQNFKIYRVNEKLYPNDEETIYSNSKSFGTNADPIDSFSINTSSIVVSEDNSKSYIRVPLDSILGRELFYNYLTLDSFSDLINSNFFGLYIKSEENNSAINGILRAELNIYYRNYFGNNDIVVNEISTLNADALNTLKIRNLFVDRSTTPLSNLTNTLPLNGNKCYVQANTGIGTKVEFPFLENFQESLGVTKVLINKAELVIKPDLTGRAESNPPSQIFAYLLDDNGQVKTKNDITISKFNFANRTSRNETTALKLSLHDNNPQLNQETVLPSLRYIDYQNGVYTIPVTSYIQSIIDKKRGHKEGLLISAENFINKYSLAELNGLVFNNIKGNEYNISLKLYYTTF